VGGSIYMASDSKASAELKSPFLDIQPQDPITLEAADGW